MTKDELKILIAKTFPDNNNGAITPEAHRGFTEKLVDSIPDIADVQTEDFKKYILRASVNASDTNLSYIVDNYDDALSDTSKYRMVLLRFRKGSSVRACWKTPMFVYDENGVLKRNYHNPLPYDTTWWEIKRHADWWNGLYRMNAAEIPFLRVTNKATNRGVQYVFANSRLSRMILGIAIYQNIDSKWQRCSNIVKCQLDIVGANTLIRRILP